MSWFDKLFGEDNGSNDDYLNKRSQRRQKAKQQEKRESLLPQNNDVYERPKGKFRFPVDGLDNEQAYQENGDVEEQHQETQQSDKTRSANGETLSVNHQHRRRRSMQKAPSENPSNNNDKTRHDQDNSQSETTREKKPHHGKRMRIQTDVLRANTHSKSNYQAPKYHQSEFKASEVPSAIFGTKKPRPLQNGVIPPTTEDNEEHNRNNETVHTENSEHEHNATSQSSTTSETQQTVFYNDQYIDSSTTKGTEGNGEPTSTNQAQEKPKVPKNNTINIENIYASQIVEEIRKERERKLLQKRQFKKALQQKRQQNTENHEDSIQHAIDEMYAKQAKHHLGESSLDDPHNDEPSHLDSSSNSEEADYSTTESDQSLESNSNNQSSSLFNYEEIDLDNISDVHTTNQPYQQVEDITEVESDRTQNGDTESQDIDEEAVDVAQSNESEGYEINQRFLDQNVSQHDNEMAQQASSNPASDNISEDEIVDAQYRELANDNNETNNERHVEQDDDITDSNDTEDQPSTDLDSHDSESELNNQSYRVTSESYSDVNTVKVSETDYTTSEINSPSHELQDDSQSIDDQSNEICETTSETSVNNYKAKESETIDNESLTHENELQDHMVVNENNNQEHDITEQSIPNVDQTDKGSTQSTKSTRLSTQTATKRNGSKPFNVVMTPSDKKRMMDAKKSRKNVSSSRLNEQYSQNSDVMQSTTVNTSSESSRDTQDEAASSSIHESIQQHETQSTNTDATVTEPSLDPETTDAIHQPNNYQMSEQVEQSEEQIETIDHTKEDTELAEHKQTTETTTEMPKLQPEFNEQQLRDSKNSAQQVEHDDKPIIRKGPNIKLPSPELLEEPEEHEIDNSWIEEKKQELNEAFYYFNVPAEVQNVTEGPSVTRFELSVEKGVKVSRITALQDDIKMALAAKDIRIEAPIPGTSLVGIEVPNQSSTKVNLRSIIDTQQFKSSESKLTVAMGYRINNEPLLMDIAKTPHALIAGATGSGKSVCINSILMSLLYKNHPEELRLLLIDPKMVELAPYNDLPHLVSPVITDVKAATQSLKWAVEEMERRYKVFAKYHVRNITAFNKKAAYEDRMPKIVIVIDELADLMMMAPQEVEQSIARIAQKARACGIHMLVATQRPSVNVITGLIKANIPTRIAFMVSSSVDSRTILDSGGAERLLGYGDMLYLGSGMNKPIRVQGTFVSDEEIDDVVDFIKQQREPEYLFEEKELLKKTEAQPQDELFNDVCRFMLQEGHISTSLIQRHFQIGYNRAARIIDQLEQLGYVSGANGSKPRDVYITEADLNND
ncbi:DNA translocase FtsK [Staphylococcus gallinarum]|uniref:DNA translocase FtsK n=1 Tax=Staphylococcus gallinarum TaxID=1293 RepID=A0A3A0W1M5_STAGA|nr:DNA translocase FtsK [Staphylococcus gallinarum]RIP34045.1 DNA translocase FtsK [Staphylococcus gallinarum]